MAALNHDTISMTTAPDAGDKIPMWDGTSEDFQAITWANLHAYTGLRKRYEAGMYYQTNGTPAADSTLITVANTIYFHAFAVGEALTVDRISLGVTTAAAAGAVLRLGIYASDADNQPGALVLDAGTIAADSTGYKEITISQALSANTLYWIAVVPQVTGTPTVRASGAGAGAEWVGHAANSTDPRTSTYTQASVTGALPNPATPTTSSAPTSSPSVKVRAA